MKLLSGVLGLFKRDEQKLSKAMGDITEFVDRTFTSDEEKQEFSLKLAKLDAASKSLMAQTGRAAMMWALAIVIVYQLVVRDFCAAAFGWVMPDTGLDIHSLIRGVLSLLTGGI